MLPISMRRFRAFPARLMSVLLLASVAGALFTGAVADAGTPSGTPTAHAFDGISTVGGLFPSATSSKHFCTASVVASPKGDVLVTAAHCIEGSAKGLVFIPGYHNGVAPYGKWTISGVYLDPQWISKGATTRDYAFLTVQPRRIDGKVTEIQQVTGANRLAYSATAGEQVTVPGYPDGHRFPITCTSRLYFDGIYRAFNCTPYPGGTSGSPWLVKTAQGDEVIGVIGGLHQGGCEVYTSYSAPFGAAAKLTYEAAVAQTHPDIAPKAGSDGCSTGL